MCLDARVYSAKWEKVHMLFNAHLEQQSDLNL